MKNLFGIILTAAFCHFLSPPGALASETTPLMPLSEVRAGMQGTWRTVVAGTEIREYPLEVIGVAENFVGPGRSLIIAQAIDDENILSGPVSGMSGSPVFIDGKLVGAYAYGFTWAKEQAIIGVTPIADMLELLDRYGDGEKPSLPGRQFPVTGAGEDSAGEFSSAGRLPPRQMLENYLQPLPTALNIAGISPGVLAHFEDNFRQLGLEPALVPMGRSAREIDTDLQPGSAVAGVLLDGDFNIAGTGTVTYRDGDQVLAFGHPFFGMGTSEIPMAAAEVMTVIRSVRSSFKLSNTGPVIGTIYQDRLTAIAGRIGRPAAVTKVTVNVDNTNGFQRTYEGNLFRHPQLSPLISTMALAESLTQTMEASSEQTFFIRSRWEIEGFEPLIQEDVATGPNSPIRLAFQHLNLFNNLATNPFASPTVHSITYDISFRDEWLITQLDSAFTDKRRARAGETVTLDLVLRNYRGERSVQQVRVPIPAYLSSEPVTIFVGDAASARRHDPDHRVRPTSLAQMVEAARGHRSRQSVYVKLLRQSPGISVEGQGMPNVLPSVAAALRSPQSQFSSSEIAQSTIWETAIPVEGEFQGQKTFRLDIE
jgi:hypothetical protein